MTFEEYWEACEEYRERFGDTFPRMPTDSMTDDEAIEQMRACIARGKPRDIYEGIPEGERAQVVF